MTEERIPPDTEGAVREYLRTRPAVASAFGARVFFGPSGGVYPQAVITRIGGGYDTVGNVDQALIQVDVWGDVHNKGTAWEWTALVLAALRDLDATPVVVAGVLLRSPGASSWAWLPDPASERARYAMTVPVTAVPT